MSDENCSHVLNRPAVPGPPLLSEVAKMTPLKISNLYMSKALQCADNILRGPNANNNNASTKDIIKLLAPPTPSSSAASSAPPLSSRIPIAPFSQEEIDRSDEYSDTLRKGDKFIKLGKMGDPKQKLVQVKEDGTLLWIDDDSMVKSRATLSSIRLVEVTLIVAGKTSDLFRSKKYAAFEEDRCLSIVGSKKTLDLVAASPEMRNKWVKALEFAMKNVHAKGVISREVTTSEKDRQNREQERRIGELEAQLAVSRTVICQKAQEVQQREQQIVLQTQKSQSELAETEEQISTLREEQHKMQEAQEGLQVQLKDARHQRQASHANHINALSALQREKEQLESEARNSGDSHMKKQAEMGALVEQSQKLLKNASKAIHERKESRAKRLNMIEVLQQEITELRLRNNAMDMQIKELKANAERQALDVEKARCIISVAQMHPHFAEMLANVMGTDLCEPLAAAAPSPAAVPAPVPASNMSAAKVLQNANAFRPAMDDIEEGNESDVSRVFSLSLSLSLSVESGSLSIFSSFLTPLLLCLIQLALSYADVIQQNRWQPDSASRCCTRCAVAFTMITRRHHCRKW